LIFKELILKTLTVVIVACFVFLPHYFINAKIGSPIDFYQLLYSYSINVLLAIGVIVLLYILRRKLKDQLGFVFMLGSMLKFVFFFLLFYPDYTSDGNLSRYEFFTFFIPYVICLITESIILSRFLNRLDSDN
jgi:hypothetical protein